MYCSPLLFCKRGRPALDRGSSTTYDEQDIFLQWQVGAVFLTLPLQSFGSAFRRSNRLQADASRCFLKAAASMAAGRPVRGEARAASILQKGGNACPCTCIRTLRSWVGEDQRRRCTDGLRAQCIGRLPVGDIFIGSDRLPRKVHIIVGLLDL
jgi:hypothetical protein